jgi:hypothetical protein
MARSRSAFSSALACCAVTCATLLIQLGDGCLSRARAYEEQLGLDLALGYARLTHSETLSPDVLTPGSALPSNLAALDVGVALGVSDWLVLRGALGYGLLLEEKMSTRQLGRVRIEGAYLVDIVEWVPFLGLGTGLWLLEDPDGGVLPRGDVHLVVGLDYLATRSWTVGLDVRVGFLMGGGQVFNVTEGQLRLTRLFELF